MYLALDQISNKILKNSVKKDLVRIIDTTYLGNEKINIELIETKNDNGRTHNVDIKRQIFIESDTLQENQDNEVRLWSEKLINEIIKGHDNLLQRIDTASLADTVRSTLHYFDLPSESGFAILQQDSILYSSRNFNRHSLAQHYEQRLFQEDFISDEATLVLDVSNRKATVLASLIGPFGFTALLLIAILVLFRLMLKRYIHQKELAEMRNDLINSMSHELKTPVSTSRIAIHNIKEQFTSNDNIHILEEENKRMQLYIDRVLGLSQVEHVSFKLRKEEINSTAFITSLIDNQQLMIQENGGKLIANLKDEALLYVDTNHLSNVFNNLIENALKYNDRAPIIEIRTEKTASEFYIHIKDNGIGINPLEQVRIFEKFYRVVEGDLYRGKGTGIGLSYVKTIMELHHGTVTVLSTKGQGSTFTLKFRLNEYSTG